jgi:hypothetical protein
LAGDPGARALAGQEVFTPKSCSIHRLAADSLELIDEPRKASGVYEIEVRAGPKRGNRNLQIVELEHKIMIPNIISIVKF